MEAIDFLSNNPIPDIVFLDILMPGMDGIETLAEIKKIRSDLPVIMVTAYASEERKEEAKRLGAVGFFAKSDDLSLAARLIKSALEKIGNSDG
jgi:CheY-like chemotaxis protein